jgi:hypothetical protein
LRFALVIRENINADHLNIRSVHRNQFCCCAASCPDFNELARLRKGVDDMTNLFVREPNQTNGVWVFSWNQFGYLGRVTLSESSPRTPLSNSKW